MNELYGISLFSGIGGWELGFKRASPRLKIIASCEILEERRKVISKRHKIPNIFKDIRNIECEQLIEGGLSIYEDTEKIEEYKNIVLQDKALDFITASFPCQSISTAGNKKGLKDKKKSGLWKEVKRLAEEIKPRYIFIENVKNLLNLGFAEVLKDLYGLGYDAEWGVIPASALGAPHPRERVWIVAYKQDASYSNMPRFWPSFASEKEEQEWWTKTTASFRSWWEIEPSICRVDDGISDELFKLERSDPRRKIEEAKEKIRKQRIEMLGDSIVPFIAEIIGKRFVELESENENC